MQLLIPKSTPGRHRSRYVPPGILTFEMGILHEGAEQINLSKEGSAHAVFSIKYHKKEISVKGQNPATVTRILLWSTIVIMCAVPLVE